MTLDTDPVFTPTVIEDLRAVLAYAEIGGDATTTNATCTIEPITSCTRSDA
ncbi:MULTISPECIES: hypothetical protein [Nocardia]|uniref:hypothetical protein n=1 Tax=Nocardia TaxID=1817 RepID=UPI001300A231|nr:MULTISPECIES: hypothetical protein [Nocardia]